MQPRPDYSINQDPLTEGEHVFYSGDVANAPDWFIVRGLSRDGGGALMYAMERVSDGHQMTAVHDRTIGREYHGHCNPRFVTGAAVVAFYRQHATPAPWLDGKVAPGYSDLRVMRSAAGHYIGREFTDDDGCVMPGSRESGYFPSASLASALLALWVQRMTAEEEDHGASMGEAQTQSAPGMR
ncbi:MAG: hypothetical protein ABIW82_16960 [Dokdonella sp.]